eukprot:TRINITY_DN13014_c0_g1_i1.p1 TRINITY_DN13014_c0_g1~~TRINITY_DN13014_c0_g1_i1.p1  ORF type:complete len:406 (+),score=63.38 TRINITY_DN13014_c0_g1_i1:28-1245(+)
MATICGLTFGKDSIKQLAYGGLGIFTCIICTVLFFNSFLIPMINYGDYERVYSCYVDKDSIYVNCNDYWNASCSVTATVSFTDDNGNTREGTGRYPTSEGVPYYRASLFASDLDYTNCYYSPENPDAEITFEDPVPSTTFITIFIVIGLIGIAGLGTAFYCGCSGFCSARRGYTETDPYKSAGKYQPTSYPEEGISPSRNRFISKVYGILSSQLVLTFAIIFTAMFVEPLRNFLQGNWWLNLVGLGIGIVLLIPLILLRKKTPVNLILLYIFTAGFAVAIAIPCTFFGITIVLQAGISTIVLFLGLTLFCMQTRIDFTFYGAGLFVILIGIISFSLLSIFLPISGFTQATYGFCIVILFSFYILYDTALLLDLYDESEYILAAVNLYLDIMNIFLYLLYIFGGRK